MNEVKDFVDLSLTNFYNMQNKSEDEFEDYKLNKPAQLFTISMNTTNQSGDRPNITKQDDGSWGYPFDLEDIAFKEWLYDVKEF